MKSSDSVARVILTAARKLWDTWGRATASHAIRGATAAVGTAIGTAAVSLVVIWVQGR